MGADSEYNGIVWTYNAEGKELAVMGADPKGNGFVATRKCRGRVKVALNPEEAVLMAIALTQGDEDPIVTVIRSGQVKHQWPRALQLPAMGAPDTAEVLP